MNQLSRKYENSLIELCNKINNQDQDINQLYPILDKTVSKQTRDYFRQNNPEENSLIELIIKNCTKNIINKINEQSFQLYAQIYGKSRELSDYHKNKISLGFEIPGGPGKMPALSCIGDISKLELIDFNSYWWKCYSINNPINDLLIQYLSQNIKNFLDEKVYNYLLMQTFSEKLNKNYLGLNTLCLFHCFHLKYQNDNPKIKELWKDNTIPVSRPIIIIDGENITITHCTVSYQKEKTWEELQNDSYYDSL